MIKFLFIRLFTFLLFLFMTTIARCENYYPNNEWFTPFTTEDWMRQFTVVGLIVIDWDQTKRFRYDGHEESNPALGPYPSQQRVDMMISAGIILHCAIAYALPRDLRMGWQLVTIILEVNAIVINTKAGYPPRSPKTGIKFEIKF